MSQAPCHDIMEAETSEPDLQTPWDKGMRMLNKLASKEEVQLDHPVVIGIELVEGCNLSCNMCFQRSRAKPINYHGMDELKQLYDQLDDAKPLKVYLTGGEPTIHPSFVEAIELFATGPYELTVFTNATLMDEELVNRIDHLSDEVTMQVSFDGIGEVHEEIRGVAVEEVTNGVERLLDAGFEVNTRTTVQPNNVDFLKDIYEKCVEMGVDFADFSPILPTFGWENVDGVSGTYLEFHENMVQNFAELISEQDEFPVSLCQDPIAVPNGEDVPDDVLPDAYLCPAGNIALEVDALGHVYPCPYLHYEEFSAGNVYETELLNIWRDVKYGGINNPQWDQLVSYRNTNHEECQSCGQVDQCKGACPASGYHYFGDLSAPDFRCRKILEDEKEKNFANKVEPQADEYAK